MTTTDLSSADLSWMEHTIAGAEQPARMVMLHASAERNTRTVLVEFPLGWRRDAVGNQPAGEEMIVLSGSLSMSGEKVPAGTYLMVEPLATRSATFVDGPTRAVVWFSGPGGGWVDGEAENAGSIRTAPVTTDLSREPSERLSGSLTVHEDLSEQTFPTDVDVLWTDRGRWAHIPAGDVVPALTGIAVVRHWG